MAVVSSDTAAVRAEKAFSAYVRGHRDSNSDDATFSGDLDLDCTRAGDLNEIAVHEGRQSQQITTPALVVAAGAMEPLYPGTQSDYWQLQIQFTLMTGVFEGASQTERQQVEILHGDRAKELTDLICDRDTVKAALNKPPHPQTDARAVDEFTVINSWISDQSGGNFIDKAMADTWTLTVHCMPWDKLR